MGWITPGVIGALGASLFYSWRRERREREKAAGVTLKPTVDDIRQKLMDDARQRYAEKRAGLER